MLGLGLNIFTLAIRRYFGGGGGQFAGSSLNLDFTSGNQSLDPRITFTRASTGTRINASGVLVSEAIDGPRFDYDPVTLQPKGLLIEEQRTNSIRNNTMVGAVAGTPGTLPTNWSTFTSLTGVSREIVSVGIENGVSYVDVRLSGTPSGSGSLNLFFDATNTAATQNQQWTASSYVKLIDGSLSGVTSVQQTLIEYNSSFGFLTQGAANFTPESSGSLNALRVAYTRTLTNASAAFTRFSYQYNFSGAALDLTLRIGMPQLELGAFATSVIPTSGAAATRAADVAVMTGANFSNWYRQDEGSVFVERLQGPIDAATARRYLSISDGTVSNSIQKYQAQGGSSNGVSVVAGVFDFAPNPTGIPAAGGVVKTALAFSASGKAMSRDGGAVSSTGVLPPLTGMNTMFIGSQLGGASVSCTHLRRVSYFPRRLSNSELQGLTS